MQTPESSLEALTKRVVMLEVQNRRLKKTGVALLILATAVIAMGQAPTKKVIAANEFVLQDPTGKTRARLTMEMKDRPALTFLDDRAVPTSSLAGGDEPFLFLNRSGTNETVQLGANKNFYGIGIYDKEIRAGLSVQKGIPGLELYDEAGHPRATIAAPKVGASLSLSSPDEKAISNLWVDSYEPGSGMSISGPAGNFRLALGESIGGPSILIEDNEGYSSILGRTDLLTTTTGRKERTPAASLVLFGKDKKLLWSAP